MQLKMCYLKCITQRLPLAFIPDSSYLMSHEHQCITPAVQISEEVEICSPGSSVRRTVNGRNVEL